MRRQIQGRRSRYSHLQAGVDRKSVREESSAFSGQVVMAAPNSAVLASFFPVAEPASGPFCSL